jgi:hypothetical protein
MCTCSDDVFDDWNWGDRCADGLGDDDCIAK